MIISERTVHTHLCDLCGVTTLVDCGISECYRREFANMCGQCQKFDTHAVLRRLVERVIRLEKAAAQGKEAGR